MTVHRLDNAPCASFLCSTGFGLGLCSRCSSSGMVLLVGPGLSVQCSKGVSSVDAWYSTTLDIHEILSNTRQGDFHIFVADVVLDILDCALGRLGLPVWFRRVYFSFHREVRLRFKLATGLEVAWTRDGGISQGCPLTMVFYRCTLCTLVPTFGKSQRRVSSAPCGQS